MQGKTVIPFNTNGGYGEGNSFQTVSELCPQSTVLEGFVTRGGLERDGQYLVIKEERAEEAQKEVESWLRKIEIFLAATSGNWYEINENGCERSTTLKSHLANTIVNTLELKKIDVPYLGLSLRHDAIK